MIESIRHCMARLRLHIKRAYLRMLLGSAEYDEHHHEHEATRADFRGEHSLCGMHTSLAASDRFVQQRLRVELARVESALWPTRGSA
jgi:hypothetical protein